MTKRPKKASLPQSSAAEYLTFVAVAGDDAASFDLRLEDDTLWMTQRLMAALYDIGLPTLNHHLKQLYADGELSEEATIRYFRIVQQEGTRQVSRQVAHYSLQAIIAVGNKVDSPKAPSSASRTCSGSTFCSKRSTKLRPPVKSILLLKPRQKKLMKKTSVRTPQTVNERL